MFDLSFGRDAVADAVKNQQQSPETASATGNLTANSPTQTRPTALLIVCAVLLIASIAIATAIVVSKFRTDTLEDHERDLENLAWVLATHVDQTFQAIELVQNSVMDRMRSIGIASGEEYDHRMSGRDVHLMLKDKISGLPYVDAISLINAQGELINFSQDGPVPTVNFANQNFFRDLKSDSQLTSLISEPQRNRGSGSRVVSLAKKLVAPNGEFLGLIVGTLELQHFESFFGSIDLGDGSSISLFRDDGTLLVRYPPIELKVGRKFSGHDQALPGNEDHGTVRLISQINGRDRLLAVRKLPHYPLVMTVGLDVATALADWENQAGYLIGAGLLLAVAIGLVTLLIARQLLRGRRKAQEILDEQARKLDSAINNMSQGLCMFDSAARLVICNERYLQMYRLSRDVVKPGCSLRELVDHRMANGTFSGAPHRYCSDILVNVARGKTAGQITETPDGRIIHVVNAPTPGGGWVATHEDITERRRAEERAGYMARHDLLTDLANRVLFLENVEKALIRLQRRGNRFAVLLLDLDQFKAVNDSLGHPVGDALLKAVAERLRACPIKTSVVARLGGDEFAILQMIERAGSEATVELANQILDTISAPYDIEGHHMVIGTSIGIAMAPDDGTNADQLLKNADLGLYRAKSEGRNTYRFFEKTMEAEAHSRHALGMDLRSAISRGEFELYYQSLIDTATREVVGAEALIRWHHPQRGLILPGSFIPLAEEIGLIVPLGEWIVRQACADAMQWPAHTKVAVNLSPVQFGKGKLLDLISVALSQSGLPPQRLELEITESVLLQKSADNLSVLHELRSLGVSIVLDDFGTGYSSLGYLRMFPFDKIKIDKSFVDDISNRADCAAIVSAVSGLGRSLNILTTAEGVETNEQFELLRAAGCGQVQGHLFSRPVPLSALSFTVANGQAQSRPPEGSERAA